MTFDETVQGVRDRYAPIDGVLPRPHDRLLDMVKRLKTLGQETLSNRQSDMEQADDIYRAFRVPDAEDKKAAERGEPIKIIYPVSYAQIQTALASCIAVFAKTPFFELESRGPSFYRSSKLMELELQYQLEYVGHILKMYQWFKDCFRYGFGKVNIGWQQQKHYATRPTLLGTVARSFPVLGYLGLPLEQVQETMAFEGVDLINEDPYNLMFDPQVGVGNIQDGNFVFNYKLMAYNELKDDPNYFNTHDIPRNKDQAGDTILQRGRSRRNAIVREFVVEGSDYVDLDTVYVKLTPRDYELSESSKMEIWKITMANDARIVAAEPSRFEHGKFPCACLEYDPDVYQTTNDGMAQTIDGLQDQLNWLLNSHMQAVRKTINNWALVDPDLIEVEDLEKRKNFIRMKRGKGGLMDRAFKQFIMQDVTQTHIKDSEDVLQMIQRTTGFSDNSMGVQLPTGRTATEVAAMQRLGSIRTRLMIQLFFDQGIKELGTQMIQNTQQFCSTPRFLKVSGDLAMQLGVDIRTLPGQLIQVKPEDLSGQYSIKMVDVNTPSDKMAIGNVLKEVLMAMGQNPQLMMLTGIKPQAMFTRMMMMFGVPGLTDLINPVMPDQTENMMKMLLQGAAGQPGANGAAVQVMPDQMLEKERQKGNLVPFGGDGNGGGNGRLDGGK